MAQVGQDSALEADTGPIEREAVSALRSVATDPKAPPAARTAAARSLLELVGRIGTKGEPARRTAADKPAGSMTLAEIEAELAGLSDS